MTVTTRTDHYNQATFGALMNVLRVVATNILIYRSCANHVLMEPADHVNSLFV
jgi:hypothetical protein